MQDEQLVTIISTWITRRDNLVRQRGIMDPSQMEFIRELQGRADELYAALPYLTLAQLEALAELTNTMLSMARQRAASYRV